MCEWPALAPWLGLLPWVLPLSTPAQQPLLTTLPSPPPPPASLLLSPTAGGKAKRKKWSKGKVREKLQNLVQFDQKTLDRMLIEVPKVRAAALQQAAALALCALHVTLALLHCPTPAYPPLPPPSPPPLAAQGGDCGCAV